MGRAIYYLALIAVGMAFVIAVSAAVIPERRTETVLAADAPAEEPVPPGRYRVTERPDLKPPYPSSQDYEPIVRDTTRHRIRVRTLPRSYELYVGGLGAQPRPAIVLFHGAGRTAASMIDMWDDTADRYGLVLVSLDAGSRGWSLDPPETEFVLAALDDAAAAYPIDHEQVYLFGHSNGAIAAQVVANRGTGPWKAVAVHAGYANPDLLRPKREAPPVRHYLGTSDGIFAPGHARIAGQRMAEAGHDFELVLIPEHSHWFYLGGPAFAEDAWRWFAERGRMARLATLQAND
ncbi:MAG: hypothetical protein MUF63_11585 [Rhodobacteraceae bacterium]|jgi:predicted esterase|nr:hypothetical protein [Paracoccaceae bacterium]